MGWGLNWQVKILVVGWVCGNCDDSVYHIHTEPSYEVYRDVWAWIGFILTSNGICGML